MKLHLLGLTLAVGGFFLGKALSTSPAPETASNETVKSSASRSVASLTESKQQHSQGPGTVNKYLPIKDPDEHYSKLEAFLPKDKLSKTLVKMSRIEHISMRSEYQQEYKNYIKEIVSDPEGSFDTLRKSVEVLPPEYEKEKNRFLQLAVELDVSKEQKKELLEKVMFDGKEENLPTKLIAFDLVLEHVGDEGAREMLDKGQIKGQLVKVFEGQLLARKPAQK